jgi:hypothetical protein
MPELKIQSETNLMDLERLLASAGLLDGEINVWLARQRKHQFFKDAALSQFFATLGRRSPFRLVDWHNEWKTDEIIEHFGENLAGLAGCVHAEKVVNLVDAASPLQKENLRFAVNERGGLLKRKDAQKPSIRELAFLAFDPEEREPLALAGLLHQQEEFIRAISDYKRTMLDLSLNEHPDLFGAGPAAQRALAEFVFELYQNGAEHGNRDADNQLLSGMRSLSIRRHNPGSMRDLHGFAEGFPELAAYVKDWTSLNRGTAFYEVSVVDNGLGILGRFVASRREFEGYLRTRNDRLALLQRILLTPKPAADMARPTPVAYTSKDVMGIERGAGRGLERALAAVARLNGFVSLRTGEFWLYRSFPKSSDLGDIAMHEVGQGPFGNVAGTCFTALFPVNLSA